MHCEAAGRATIHYGDKPFRMLDDRSWSVARRLSDMDDLGIGIQVLSPMPELLSYWLDTGHAETLLDHVNGSVADMIAQAPSRFRGFGALPLQDPDRAAALVPRLREKFGLNGVEIGSNVNGLMLGEERFLPFFAAAEASNMPVFVHALHPVATQSEGALFNSLVGFPLDVTMAAASLILSGTLARFPGLRIGFSHGGGAIAAIRGRIMRGLAEAPVEGLDFEKLLGRLFFDSNVYDPAYLSHLVSIAPGQVFAGTDYPYRIMQEDPRAYIARAGLPPDDMADISSKAALRFLGES